MRSKREAVSFTSKPYTIAVILDPVKSPWRIVIYSGVIMYFVKVHGRPKNKIRFLSEYTIALSLSLCIKLLCLT
jgi:hypothetical protein